MGIISRITSYVPIVNKVQSLYSVGRKIKNHIYTRRNFKILMKKHSATLDQLTAANSVAINYAKQDIMDMTAQDYCTEYGIPFREISSFFLI